MRYKLLYLRSSSLIIVTVVVEGSFISMCESNDDALILSLKVSLLSYRSSSCIGTLYEKVVSLKGIETLYSEEI